MAGLLCFYSVNIASSNSLSITLAKYEDNILPVQQLYQRLQLYDKILVLSSITLLPKQFVD